MEKETNSLIMVIFAVTALTVGIIPIGWELSKRGTSEGFASNTKMANQLWNAKATDPALVTNSLDPANFYGTPIIPGAINPNLSGVQFDTSVWPPKLKIQGNEFGNTPPPGAKVLQITDTTRNWTASLGGSVSPVISLWANNEIDISGFTGYGAADTNVWSDGNGSFVFAPGDSLQIQVTNPQTGQQSKLTATYPTDAQMPVVTVNKLPSLITGVSQTVSGTVTFNGVPLANQAVSLSAGNGTFSGGNGVQVVSPKEYVVYTNAQGQYSAVYTPASQGTESITVMADAETAAQTVTVAPPFTVTLTAQGDSTDNNVTLTATVNYPLNGFTLSIIDQTTNTVIASTTQGTTLSKQITQTANQTDIYIAEIN